MSTAIVVTSLYRPAVYLRRYISSVLIWSSVGFVASTVVYFIVLVASAWAVGQVVGGKPSVVGGVAMGGMVFIVPFVAAASGLMGGAVFGLWKTMRTSRRAAQPAAGADR
jgi:hypothetical protein